MIATSTHLRVVIVTNTQLHVAIATYTQLRVAIVTYTVACGDCYLQLHVVIVTYTQLRMAIVTYTQLRVAMSLWMIFLRCRNWMPRMICMAMYTSCWVFSVCTHPNRYISHTKHTHTHTQIHPQVHKHTHIHTHTHTYTHIHTHTHTHTHAHAHTCVHMRTHTSVCTCAHAHTTYKATIGTCRTGSFYNTEIELNAQQDLSVAATQRQVLHGTFMSHKDHLGKST